MRGIAAGRDWTQGSILRNLLSMSWPMIVANSVNMIGPTVDMIWVGKLGSAAIAGVGVSGIAVMLAQSGLGGLFMGMRALVARFVGAGDEKQANHVAQQAIVIGAGASIVLAIIGIFLSEKILRLIGVEQEVITQGAGYLRIQFVGMTAMSFRTMAEGVMQSSGDTTTPMKIAVVFRVVHVVVSPLLIFGLWIFPRMGVNGAAMTGVVSQSLGTVLAFWFLMTGRSRLKLSFKGFRIDLPTIWRIIRIGIPATFMGMEQNLRSFIFIKFMAPFGTLAMAAHTLTGRVEMFLFMPAWGLGMASGILAGQNLGAHRPDRAERTGWLASALVEGFILVFVLFLLLWAELPVRVFSSEPSLVATAATFLRIATVGYIVMGVAAVFQQCISGSGDTFVPMVVSLITGWLIQLPLAYFLPRVGDLGVYGIRWAIVVPTVFGAIAYTVYFRMGRWKRKEV
jgi:putative MATE family efflux protein